MIVCFGSINLDLIFITPTLPVAGQTVLGPSVRIESGGKGGNQALAAARDGATVTMAGAVGTDALAEDALKLLRDAGIDLTRVAKVADTTGCAAICVDTAGENLIAVGSGANLHAAHDLVEDALLTAATTLLLQGETAFAQTATLIARARKAGARIVLNLAPAGPLDMAAIRQVDVLVVNADEAASVAARLDVPPNAAALHEALGMVVVVTLGADGLAAATPQGAIRLPGHAVQVRDTTGAGDCFTGVLAAALDRGMPIEAALRRANEAAALCCTKPGTQGSMPMAADTDGFDLQHR